MVKAFFPPVEKANNFGETYVAIRVIFEHCPLSDEEFFYLPIDVVKNLVEVLEKVLEAKQ